MNPIGVDPSKPYVYVTVTGLWPDSDLVVYFLAPPPPAAGGSLDFTCTGLRFAVVTEAEQTGTVQIDLSPR
jgi:hypothetical protein